MRLLFHNALLPELMNPAYYLVEDFLVKRSLSKLGVTIKLEDLDVFDVKYLTIVQSEIDKLEGERVKNRNSSRH